MQNSKLSSQILPEISESWHLFIQKVESELRSLNATNNKNNNRIKELEIHLPKLDEMKKVCALNVKEIFSYRTFLSYFNLGLKRYLDGLDFLKENNNLDNDAVGQLYNDIINHPVITQLKDEYNNLPQTIKKTDELIKQYEGLISGEVIDQSLIQELLDKFELDDKTKKDVLLYSLVIKAVKENEKIENKEAKEAKIIKSTNKAEELIKIYEEKNNEYKKLLSNCANIFGKMSVEEITKYESEVSNFDQISLDNYDKSTLLKIYVIAFSQIKTKIDSLIETVKDLMMDKVNLNKENKNLEELINKYDLMINKLSGQMPNIDEVDYDKDFFLALDLFYRPLADRRLLSFNRAALKEYIPILASRTYLHDTRGEIRHMSGVDNIEDAINKRIDILITRDFKLSYAMVGDKVLILGMSNTDDFNYENRFKQAMRRNMGIVCNQIDCIEVKDKNYLKLQMELIDRIFNSRVK